MAIFVGGENISFIRTKTGWKWVHRPASAAASAQKQGAAYPISKKN